MKAEEGNYFARLSAVNVNEHLEKKGAFSYLSWPYAVAQLRQAHPTATWAVCRFEGLPYLRSEAGHFVEVAVTVEGVTLSQIHPVLDARNRPIPEPSSFDINTSIQRCLVKAIALHGLGLYIYAGEDLPEGTERTAPVPTEPMEPVPEAVTPIRRPGTRPTVTAAQQAEIQRRLRAVGGDLVRLLAYFRVDKLQDIPASDYERVIRSLDKRRAA